MTPLIELKNLHTQFFLTDGVVRAVNDVSYSMEIGEILGVVGESGCGKSVHALSIMQLIPDPPGKITEGEILFEGSDLLKLSDSEMRKIRGRDIAMIFQDPMTSLNPVYTVGFQLVEALRLHNDMTKNEARSRARELLQQVGIPGAKDRLDDFPHQFSGGMRQRAMIAMGLSCNPKLLIADEPTTALDVTIQAQIVDLVKKLQDDFGMAIMWITHDLGVVAEMAKRINVMYAGSIIETGKIRKIYKNTKHPYTMGLLGSLPRLDDPPGSELLSIPGLPPDLLALPKGCAFTARCGYATEKCVSEKPHLVEIEGQDHKVACWRWEEIAGGAKPK
ncbi:MAG: ABC transporter ATP-binding protein [Anaerolineaceae bacterium]|nr:ABC transporter ATP-binding protein [Anaerolineaceae bacterium]